jgi:hypothetical protein
MTVGTSTVFNTGSVAGAVFAVDTLDLNQASSSVVDFGTTCSEEYPLTGDSSWSDGCTLDVPSYVKVTMTNGYISPQLGPGLLYH